MSEIWEIAKNMEKDGMEYYNRMARETPVPELAGVFHFLAEQEKGHYDFFDSLLKNKPITELEKKDATEAAHKIFKEIAPKFNDGDPEFQSAANAYRTALTMESNAAEYFSKLLASARTEEEKKNIEQLVEEEKKHEKIIQSIIEFLERPTEWIDDAEVRYEESV